MTENQVELWLVRHGQTDWNLQGRYQGQADHPLNAAGLAQAEALAAKLAEEPFEALVSSDLLRAQQTARILSRSCGLTIRLEPRLREVHQGEWEGKTIAEIRSQFEGTLAQRLGNESFAPPGGESVLDVARRTWAAADDLARDYPGRRILVVSHGLAIATLVAKSRGIPLGKVYTLIPDNVQIEKLVWSVQDEQIPTAIQTT